ncbi:MAG: glutathione S-transferase family protein [Beijerinckiaceae bacterium]
MILIGQYDSPFVRRVGIALTLYGLPFTHRPWSVFADAEKIRAFNPLTRVPTLALENSTVLTESHLILDYLDSRAPAGQAMTPAHEPDRHRHLRISGLAMGLADKAVSLFYEKRLPDVASDVWIGRCRTQISTVLTVLDMERKARPGPYWFGPSMSHADVALAVAWRFTTEAHPDVIAPDAYPALRAHSAHHEALPVFRTIQQAFIPPA